MGSFRATLELGGKFGHGRVQVQMNWQTENMNVNVGKNFNMQIGEEASVNVEGNSSLMVNKTRRSLFLKIT